MNIVASRDGSHLFATIGSNSNAGENGLAADEGRARIVQIDPKTRVSRDFATGWFDHLPDRERLARALSPIEYVRPHGPPVITVHGDADPVVPFEHARRLTAALTAAGVINKLVVVHGGKHGDFGGNDMVRSVRAVRQFLTRLKILQKSAP